MIVGVIGAMQEEIDTLLQEFRPAWQCSKAGLLFTTCKVENVEVIIVKSGIGKVNAALCTQILISDFDVTHIINVGVAGGIAENIVPGDIVISDSTVQHDYDLTAFGAEVGEIPEVGKVFDCDKGLYDAAFKAAELVENVKVLSGLIVSGDSFIQGQAKLDSILEHFDAHAVEMEGGAIGQVCYLNKVPFIVIRSISDNANTGAVIDFERFKAIASKNAGIIVGGMIRELSEGCA